MTLEFNQIHRNDHLPGRIAAEIAREINDRNSGPATGCRRNMFWRKPSASAARSFVKRSRNCATKVLSKHGKAWALSLPIPGRDCPFASSGPV